MKHETTSLNTKIMLADSLKRFMEKKPLSKITVSEIIADCGVNRKTFYYHFADIYSLLKWMLEREAIDVVKQFDLLIDYRQAALFVMNYVNNNSHLLNCAYDSMGRDEMKRFFYSDFIGIVRMIIGDAEKKLGVRMEAEFREFLAHLYTESIAGILIDEFKSKKKYDPEKTVEYVSLILKSSLPGILKNAPKETQGEEPREASDNSK